MSNNLYIMATQGKSGKSAIALGLMEMLVRKIEKVGFFRPIINVGANRASRDADIDLILSHYGLDIPYEDTYGYTVREASKLISHGRQDELLEGIIEKYNKIKENFDFILCEGTDFASSTAAFEFDINGDLSKNLGAPVLIVANAFEQSMHDVIRSIELARESLEEKGCVTIGTIVNRADLQEKDKIISVLKDRELMTDQLIYVIPNEEFLGTPTIGEIASAVGAKILFGESQLHRHVHSFTVAAMQVHNFLSRIEYGTLVITPGDRSDVIVACLAAASSNAFHNISGICLTGDLKPEDPVWKLIEGFPQIIPILSMKENTFPAAMEISNVHSKIAPGDHEKIAKALVLFEENVDVDELSQLVITTKSDFVTPKMFEFGLLQKARCCKKHIVLPEGEEERILEAAGVLNHRQVVNITLLGNEIVIREKAGRLGINIEGITIVEPQKSDRLDDYANEYYKLRQHKGITLEKARDTMCDVNFFGSMMVHMREADGMVSGATHSTAATIRPALQIIKTQPGVSIVSSVFFMCLEKVLVYGDCAVNTNPDAAQLAEIAISSAKTALAFGVDPLVAMLSYSSGESGTGEDVDKVREATKIAKQLALTQYPGLKLEGPMQYDSAVDPETARTKMPDSEIAGKATVFIFPDLNAGNNTYKAVQRSAGVVAMGPILQGLKYPVNDLSRGCTVPDIVNTVIITAIQAEQAAHI